MSADRAPGKATGEGVKGQHTILGYVAFRDWKMHVRDWNAARGVQAQEWPDMLRLCRAV